MHTRESIIEVIKSALSGISGKALPPGAGEDMALVDEGAGLSSVQLIELISTLEEQLSFQFDEDDLRMSSFRNLGILADTVTARLRGGSAGGA